MNSTDNLNEKPLWTKNFVLLIAVNLLMFVSFQLYPPALPPYLKSLGVAESLLGWYTALTTIAAFIIRPFVGVMLDRCGRKPVFLCGLAVVFAVVVLMFFFPYAVPLLFLRFFHGIGWGAITTSAATVATDNIPKKRMGEGIGYFSLSISLSLALGPAVALSLPMDRLLECSVYIMVAAIGGALVLKYKSVERTEEQRFRFALEKTSLMPTAVICITNICFGALVTFLVIYSQFRGIDNISSFYVLYAVMLMLTRPFIGKLVDKNLYLFTMLLGICCLCMALFVIAFAQSLLQFNLGAVLYGLGQGAVHTTAQTLSVVNAAKERIGIANATFAMGFDVGLSAGAVLSGLLVSWFGYSGMFLLMIGMPVCAAVLFVYECRHNAFCPKE